MPRPASALWTHFRREAATKRAVCKYCAHNMCGLVSRMRAHLARKCPDCPAQVKEEMFEADMSRKMALAMAGAAADAASAGPAAGSGPATAPAAASPHSVLSSLSAAPPAGPSAASASRGNGSSNGSSNGNGLLLAPGDGPPVKKQRRARLSPAPAAAASLADDKGDDIDSCVAKAVLGAALPVAVVENPAFARMLKRLAPPGYEPPSAFALATSALDLEYTEAQLKLRAEVLDAQAVCLGVESWASTLQRPILSCVVHNTPTPGVFALESTGEVPHTPEVLVEKIESVMTQIGTGRVAVVVTDTTTSESMKQAALALQAKYPSITFLPSCAHAMNAMVAELLALAPVAATVSVCHELARFLAAHHVARAALARIAEQMQGLEPSSSSSVASSVASVLLSPLGAFDADASMGAAAAAAAACSSSSVSPSSYYYSTAYTPASAYSPPATASTLASSASSASSNPVVALERLLSVHHHRHSLDILLAENHALNGLSALAKEKLLRLSFWEDVSTLAALLEPFLELLRTFDADYPLLSTFYHRFTLLWSHVDKFTTNNGGPGSSGNSGGGAGNNGAASNGAGGVNAGSTAGGSANNSTSGNGAQAADHLTGSASSATGALASRCQRIMSDYWQAIQHPAMYTAYMLDPRFPASSLSSEATSEVLAYLKRAADPNSFANVVSELTRFTGRAGLFADDAVWESAQKCGPLNWWKGFIGGACPNLQAVALRTLCFPASSGLSRARRDMFDRIQAANARYMNDEQAAKAALVYFNTALAATASAVSEDDSGVSNETIV